MSLEKINYHLQDRYQSKDNIELLNDIKKRIHELTKVEVGIQLKPPSTIVLKCSSSSAVSELNNQKEYLLGEVNTILASRRHLPMNSIIFRIAEN